MAILLTLSPIPARPYWPLHPSSDLSRLSFVRWWPADHYARRHHELLPMPAQSVPAMMKRRTAPSRPAFQMEAAIRRCINNGGSRFAGQGLSILNPAVRFRLPPPFRDRDLPSRWSYQCPLNQFPHRLAPPQAVTLGILLDSLVLLSRDENTQMIV